MPFISSVRGSYGAQGRFGRRAIKGLGGTITEAGGYTIHTFNFADSGTAFTSGVAQSVEYLVIAGGASGGNSHGNQTGGCGGGGAGGMLSGSLSVGAQAYTITVGAGGQRETRGASNAFDQSEVGYNGANSVFSNITAVGGGTGGNDGTPTMGNGTAMRAQTYGSTQSSPMMANGRAGGSGGGAGSGGNVGLATSGQGYNGGDDNGSRYGGGGGAGGAGETPSSSSSSRHGQGGNGLSNSITGTAVAYAGGGGASGQNASAGGALLGLGSSTGGGGAGGPHLSTVFQPGSTAAIPNGGYTASAQNGTDGLGAGGGAAGGADGIVGNTQQNGKGGNGIVIIRYPS
jgi:hypothetical protein